MKIEWKTYWLAFLLMGLSSEGIGAQNGETHQHEADGIKNVSENLSVKLQELHERIKTLEQVLRKQGYTVESEKVSPSMGSDTNGGMSMDSGSDMGGMGMMGMMKGKGAKTMQISALPGFPGASHIYHIGATEFFLDHGEHLKLEREQIVKLNRIREEATLTGATFDRQIEEAEQELWKITASDAPQAENVEVKIRKIESYKSEQRIEYIRAVGMAAEVLTKTQIALLTGRGLVEDLTSSSDHQH